MNFQEMKYLNRDEVDTITINEDGKYVITYENGNILTLPKSLYLDYRRKIRMEKIINLCKLI